MCQSCTPNSLSVAVAGAEREPRHRRVHDARRHRVGADALGAWSVASDFTSISTAPFDAQYAPMPGAATKLESLAMTAIAPPPAGASRGSRAWQQSHTPFTLTSKTTSQSCLLDVGQRRHRPGIDRRRRAARRARRRRSTRCGDRGRDLGLARDVAGEGEREAAVRATGLGQRRLGAREVEVDRRHPCTLHRQSAKGRPAIPEAAPVTSATRPSIDPAIAEVCTLRRRPSAPADGTFCSVNDWRERTVLAYLDEPPFCAPGPHGHPAGCDIEVAEHVLAEAGVRQVVFELATFPELIPGLIDGRWHVSTPMFVTPERAGRIRFAGRCGPRSTASWCARATRRRTRATRRSPLIPVRGWPSSSTRCSARRRSAQASSSSRSSSSETRTPPRSP